MTRIGELNREVLIQTRTRSPSGADSLDDIFATTETVWAKIVTLKGTARIGTVNAGEGPTHRFILRAEATIDSEHYLRYASKLYRVIDVENVDEQDHFKDVLVEEMRDA